MSERSQTVPRPEGEYFESSRFAGLSFLLGLIAVVALALCIAGAFLNPHQFSYSWLFAFAFFFTLCAGCFFWTIVHHATDADWSVVVRRQLENIAALLVVLALLFVPILLLRHHLYAWMDIPPGAEASLDEKRAYLNWYFFLGRAVLFLGFFAFAALALRRFSVEQDKDGNPRFTIWMRKVAFISLPMFALCLTFGAFDWLMSLNYRWFSTMFGVYRSIHAHLVCEYPGGDTIFYHSKHRIVVGAEHAASGRALLRTICDFAFALDQKGTAPALLCGWMDCLHANARHVPHRLAGVTWHRRARQHLGSAFSHRHRRDPRVRLSASCSPDFSFSSARPAPD